MKRYLLGLLAVPIMSPLLSFASAADYTFTSNDFNGPYSPNSFTLSSDSLIDSVSYTEHSSEYGAICVCNSLEEDCSYDYEGTNDNLLCSFDTDSNNNSCNNKSLSAGTYYINGCTDKYFASVSLNISSSSSGSSDSVFPDISVPSSFTSGITELVNNFGSTIANWIPIVILITLGITCIYALFRVVRNYARRSFKG